MGKALVFEGINVVNPLRTVNFTPDTAEEWVNRYASVATSVTAADKTALVTFINTLMDANLWDKVRDFFPMLGGLSGYSVSLNRPTKNFDWNMPTGTTWDSNRNAPYLELAGLASGKSLDYTDEDELFDNQSSTFIISFKSKKNMSATLVCDNLYSYPMSDTNCIVHGVIGWGSLGWWPIVYQDSSFFPGYSGAENKDNIICVTFGEESRNGYVNNDTTILNFINMAAEESASKPAKFAFGGYYPGEGAAPANNTLNGIINSFICMDCFVTSEQATLILNAIYALDETLGRHQDFL